MHRSNESAASRFMVWVMLPALLWCLRAEAVPSYARQTGSDCADCHIGAYGPHLTPHGIRFKLGGYTETDGKGLKIPLAAQVQATYTRTNAANPNTAGKADTRVTEIDGYLAGRWSANIGSYIRAQHSEGLGNPTYTQLDDTDIRFASEATLASKSLVWGVTVNNNPGIQDPIDALPAWGFGGVGPGRDSVSGTLDGSLLNKYQGGLAHRVIGASAYGFYDDHWYGELGTYRSLSIGTQDKLGLPAAATGSVVGDPGRLSDALYWRFAYLMDLKTSFLSVGIVGFDTQLQPGPARIGPDNKIDDIGADVDYEYLGNRDHVVQLRGTYIHEHRRYGASSVDVPFPPFALPAPSTGSVNESTMAGTYFYKNTLGITVARTWVTASQDPVRFEPYGTPDSTFTYIGPIWTVLGKDDSWGPSAVNLQIGTIWLRFDKFNGSSTAIFGHSPFAPLVDSKDLNVWQLFVKVAF